MNNVLAEPMMTIEPYEDRIDGLFRELELAVKWQRPSILFALFKSDHVRADVENAIMARLVELGQSVFHLKLAIGMTDIAESISEMRNIEQVVFFVDSLKDVDHKDKHNIYLALNNRRERFIDQSVRIVFWMNESEVSQLANTAPDFWAFRHRVIEFVDSPKPEQILLRTLETTLKDSLTENDQVSGSHEKTVAYANLLLTLGILHWRNHEYEHSLKSLQSAQEIAMLLDDNVYESEVYNAIALVRSELGETKEAIIAFEKAIELAPDRIMAWNNLGILYEKLGDHERSVAAYCKAIEYKATDVIAWNGLANALFKLGRVEEAISAYEKAIDYSPTYAKAWEGLGFIYASIGKYGEAIDAYKKALEFNKNLIDSWLGLGDVLSHQNRNYYALKAYERAISIEPDNAQALYALGNQYFASDDYKRAIEAYSRALELGWDW